MKGPSGNGPKSDRGACSTSARDAAYVRKGLFLAALTGVIFSLDGPILKQGLVKEPFSIPEFWLLAPLFAAGCHDISAACLSLVLNVAQGKGREVFRTFCSKPGRYCVMGAFMGAPLGMGGYLMGISLAGPAYALPISTLYPAIAAVLARFFLKERISARAMCGLVLCVAGAFTVGWSAPQGGVGGQAFYLGLGFAFLAAFGWGLEGCVGGYATSMIDPEIGITIRQLTSALTNLLVLVPLFAFIGGDSAFGMIRTVFTDVDAMPWFIVAGFGAYFAFMLWYKGNAMCGTALGMSCNGAFSFWGPFFCWLVLGLWFGIDGYALAPIAWLAAVVMIVGIFIIAVNPLDFFRKKG